MLKSGRKKVHAEDQDLDSEEEEDKADGDENIDHAAEEEVVLLESWVEWIQRTTHTAEDAARVAGIRDWAKEQSRRK